MSTTLEQWQAGKAVGGLPPWDGTGIPLPVDSTGWPEFPDGPDPVPITVTPGSTQTVASTDPNVVADPTTAWASDEFATFTDGEFTWDGDSWEPYVPVPPGPVTLTVVITPDALDGTADAAVTVTADGDGIVDPKVEWSINEGTTYTELAEVAGGDGRSWTATVPAASYAGGSALWVQASKITGDVTAIPGMDTAAITAADPNMGWTVAELREFAADHNPPIDIPSSATTKAQILQVILAYLAGHPEEN